MPTVNNRWLMTPFLTASVLLIPATALPEAAPTPDQGTVATPAAELNEIVITAQRRSETAQKVPIAVTVLGPQQLQQFDMRSIDDIQTMTPNLTFDSAYGFSQLFIRGIGSSFTTAGLENAVATYVDGAYVERGFGTVFDLLDVDSVQALKGPQGTLWGRNATGGAILINTANPTDKFEVHATGEYGRFDQALTDVVVNVPISDTLSARFAGRYKQYGDYVYNIDTNSKIGGSSSEDIRGKLKWEPNQNFNAVLTVEHTYDRNPVLTEHESLNAPYCLACAIVPGARGGASLGYFDTDLNYIPQPTVTATAENLRMRLTSGIFNLESVSSYRDENAPSPSDQDFSRGDFFDFESLTGGKTFTQDLTVATESGKWWDVLLGLSYLHDKGYYGLTADGASFRTIIPEQLPTVRNDVTTESVSGFGEVTVKPLPRVKLIAGGRYSYDRKNQQSTESQAANIAFAGNSGVLAFNAQKSFVSFTPRFVASYDIDIVNFYASYSEGFKSGGYNTPAFAPEAAILPESIKNYEIGAKFVSPDHTLHVNLAAFDYRYSNIQVTIVDINAGGAVIKNAAKARGRGLELDTQYQPLTWLQAFGGASYLHARFESFPDASVAGPVDAAGNPVAVGSPLAAGLGGVAENLAGFPLARAPDCTAFGGLNLRIPVGNDWRADFSGVARYSAKFDFVPGAGGPLRLDSNPAYTLVNLSGSIGPADDSYRVGFFVDNVLNERYWLSAQTSAPFGAYTAPARPVTFGLRASINY